jgi:uncharacterized coiled-coil protein SlyX
MKRHWWRPALPALCLLPTLLACSPQRTAGTPAPASGTSTRAPSDLEPRIARLELRLLERDAQIEELERLLDEARREVVRAMAKLQTLATRAEAASAIAEAELASQELGRRVGPAGAPEVAQVGQLITLSTAEFDRQNFGGALYLANQAKGLAATRRGRLASDRDGLRPGETPFAVTLRLQTLSPTNVRSGPGLGHSVVVTLPKGAPVLGHSSAGEWVRISSEAGRSGWVFVSLVGRR